MLFLAFLIKIIPTYRNIWIISERGDDARDNGYHLYKYINELNAKPNIFYIIDRKSEDFHKVSRYSNYILKGSLKHWLFFAASEVKISTHIMGYAPDIYLFIWLDKYNLVFGKKIFLQHGIIYNDLKGLYYPNVKLDLFVCGAKPEYKYVSENFNHPEGTIKYLGLTRYDNLKDSQDKSFILLMPTWRSWLNNCKNDEEFKKSEYFKKYNSLINSPELLKVLSLNNYKLIFYPHYEIQKYLHCFEIEKERVVIANKNDFDVQYLLNTASLLITDYSSVYFDFAFMKKPILFYTFDKDQFLHYHYQQGYLDVDNNPFGKSYSKQVEIINSLKKSIENKNVISKDVEKQVEYFFEYRDNNNCERNYKAILSLLKS